MVVTPASTAGVVEEEVSPRPGGSVEGVGLMGRAPRLSLVRLISHRVAGTVQRNHFCHTVLLRVIVVFFLVRMSVTMKSLQLFTCEWPSRPRVGSGDEGERSVLLNGLAADCDGPDTRCVIHGIGVPFFEVYGLGIPLAAVGLLF